MFLVEAVTESNCHTFLASLLDTASPSDSEPSAPTDAGAAGFPSLDVASTAFAQDDEWLEYELGQLALGPSEQEENSDFLQSPVPPDNLFPVHHVKHDYLKGITKDFSREETARFIGKGGFATVHLGNE